MQPVQWWFLFLVGVVLGGGGSGYAPRAAAQSYNAQGVLTIEVCGTSYAPCKGKPWGGAQTDGQTWLGNDASSLQVKDKNGAVIGRTRINPTAAQTPAGWSGPTSPPLTAPETLTYPWNGTTYTSFGAACSAAAALGNGQVCSTHSSGNATEARSVESAAGGVCTIRSVCTAPDSTVIWNITTNPAPAIGTAAVCPAGYTASAGVCTLDNPSSVIYPDGTPTETIRTGNAASMNPQNAPGGSSGVSASGSQVNYSAPGGGSQGTVRVTYNADGSSTITQTVPLGGGRSGVSELLVGDDGNGNQVVKGVRESINMGEGASVSDTPAQIPPCGVPGSSPCKIDETGTPSGSGAFAGATGELNTAAQSRQDAITKAGGSEKVTSFGWSWSWSPPAASCSSWSFTFKEWSAPVDWCPWLARVRDLFGWFFGISCAIYIWKSATGAVSGV